MRILSYNPGHDGAIALIEDGRLIFSVEAEKNSNYRHSAVSIADVLDAVGQLSNVPDVICMGGWWLLDHYEFLHGSRRNAGYRGVSEAGAIMEKGRFLRGRTDYFSSSHERSHIMCAFGMSPFPKGIPSYALVWEGEMGSFYEIGADLGITLIGDVLTQPGNRYGLLYGLADPTFPKDGPYPRESDAGKLMALASFSSRSTPTIDERALLAFLLDGPYPKLSDYDAVAKAPHLDVGFEDAAFRDFAGIYSDAIFDRFERFARERLERGRPLLIAGGCGLNCDWNTRWAQSGLFSDVFVPPVANDTGSAIGTAIDAQFRYTGEPKIDWNVYAGTDFRMSGDIDLSTYDVFEKDYALVADMLANDLVLGWAYGRYEIGPRALGNRSILAAPFRNATRERLNEIKQREQFRPIAPVCLREEAERWFGCRVNSPHMLYTFRATTNELHAVTHVNGTARLQTVTSRSNPELHDLLVAFQVRTGSGVLCNTSLNFKNKGFINDITDLDVFAREHGLDGFAVGARTYLLRSSPQYQAYLRQADHPAPRPVKRGKEALTTTLSIGSGDGLEELRDMRPFPIGFEEDEALRSAYIHQITLLQLGDDRSIELVDCSSSSIPRTLIRFWHNELELPDDVRACMASWDGLTDEGFVLRSFDDGAAESYIEAFYGQRERAAFARCEHPAMRCDYIRMCVLLAEGGLHVDADDVLLGDGWKSFFQNDRMKVQPLCYDITAGGMMPSADIWRTDLPPGERVFYVNNDPIAAPAGHPVLRLALERATDSLLGSEGFLEIQATTGPGNLTAALAAHARLLQIADQPFDFEFIRDWDVIAEMRWDLSYRNERRQQEPRRPELQQREPLRRHLPRHHHLQQLG